MALNRKYCVIDLETGLPVVSGIVSRTEAKIARNRLITETNTMLRFVVKTDVDHPDGAGLLVR